jgi:hydrogenase expression/formation protein HypC
VPVFFAAALVPRKGEKMCLAIPMQVKTIDNFQCICEARGIEREVSLFMLQHEAIAPGDFVLVHVGYAIQKVSEEDASSSWELFDEILAADA